MFASGSKPKPNANKPMMARGGGNPPQRQMMPARPLRNTLTTVSIGLTNTVVKTTRRSKFTDCESPPTAAALRAQRLNNTNFKNRTANLTNQRDRPFVFPKTEPRKVPPAQRTFARVIKPPAKVVEPPPPVKVHKPYLSEIGIQANEQEILNHDLLIGDVKYLMPSKTLLAEIEREKRAIKKKAMLQQQRKFEEHAAKEEEHLTDLQEFLEKSVITKRSRPQRKIVDFDKNLIKSMDELLSREIPRTESITDIKGRIRKKEKELLSLFDTVDNLQFYGKKN